MVIGIEEERKKNERKKLKKYNSVITKFYVLHVRIMERLR